MTSLTQHSAAPVRMERLALPATDGYPLRSVYHAPGHAHGNLLVAGATVAQRFYRRFAEHAARQGFDVLTLDYRGIGESAPASLKGFAMSYLDWAYRDLAAAVELLGREERPLYWIGHSFGGHAIGLLPDHGRLAALQLRQRRRLERLDVAPRSAQGAPAVDPGAAAAGGLERLHGLEPAGHGRRPAAGVYRDWKRWCRHPRYYFDDPAMRHLHQRYAAVRTPCLFATALDDPWHRRARGTPSSRPTATHRWKPSTCDPTVDRSDTWATSAPVQRRCGTTPCAG